MTAPNPGHGEPALAARHVAVARRGLTEVTFAVTPGGRHALIAGADIIAAILDVLTGAVPIERGYLTVFGFPVAPDGMGQVAATQLAFVTRTAPALPPVTVADTIAASIHGRSSTASGGDNDAQRRADIQAVLRLHGLADHADDPVTGLPPGRRRLLDLAIAHARRTPVIVVEEPRADLTPQQVHTFSRAFAAPGSGGQVAVLFLARTAAAVTGLATHLTTIRDGRSHPPVAVADLHTRADHTGRPSLTEGPLP